MRKYPTRHCGAPWTNAGPWSCSSSRIMASSHQVSKSYTPGNHSRGLDRISHHLSVPQPRPQQPSKPAMQTFSHPRCVCN